jgi:hypothetical protein
LDISSKVNVSDVQTVVSAANTTNPVTGKAVNDFVKPISDNIAGNKIPELTKIATTTEIDFAVDNINISISKLFYLRCRNANGSIPTSINYSVRNSGGALGSGTISLDANGEGSFSTSNTSVTIFRISGTTSGYVASIISDVNTVGKKLLILPTNTANIANNTTNILGNTKDIAILNENIAGNKIATLIKTADSAILEFTVDNVNITIGKTFYARFLNANGTIPTSVSYSFRNAGGALGSGTMALDAKGEGSLSIGNSNTTIFRISGITSGFIGSIISDENTVGKKLLQSGVNATNIATNATNIAANTKDIKEVKLEYNQYFDPSNTTIVDSKNITRAIKAVKISILNSAFSPYDVNYKNVKHVRFGTVKYTANNFIQISTYYGSGFGVADPEIGVTGASSTIDISSWVASDLLGMKDITITNGIVSFTYSLYMPEFIAMFLTQRSLLIGNSRLLDSVFLDAYFKTDRINGVLPTYAKYINNKSSEKCTHLMFQNVGWGLKPTRFNAPVATDFHGQIETLRDLVKWCVDDSAINAAVNMFLIAGDYAADAEVKTKAQYVNVISLIFEQLELLGKPALFCQGNHDKNWEAVGNAATVSYYVTDAEVRSLVYDRAYNLMSTTDKANFVFGSATNALYYYFDKTHNGQKFRTISINDYELPETLDGTGKFLYSATDGAVTYPFSTYINRLNFNSLLILYMPH